MFWENQRVLVTGGAGFLGSHVVDALKKRGVTDIIMPRSSTCDLRLRENCHRVVQGVNIVIHLAAKVGGIFFNQEHPGEMVFDNVVMGAHLLEEARLANVKKFVIIGTVCAYPKFNPIPFKEEDLWSGYPEETNAPYGLAKKMLLVQSQAYRKQYDFNSIFLLPTNLYGIRDNFDPSSSHVIPALIKRILDAKKNDAKEVIIWGSGKATREFLFVEDAAEGILLATEKYNKEAPVNLGSGIEVSIKDLVKLIVKITGFEGKIIWDSTKLEGQPRRCLDTSRAKREFGFEARTELKVGLRKTIDWVNSRG